MYKFEPTGTLSYVTAEGDVLPPCYCPDVPAGRLREVLLTEEEYTICRVQNGVAHCCGASFLCNLSSRFFNDFDKIIEFLKNNKNNEELRWVIQDSVFLYLSDETLDYGDKDFRKHPKLKEVFTFKNYATKPYSGSKVSLFVLDLT
jgi:hypothetical protein